MLSSNAGSSSTTMMFAMREGAKCAPSLPECGRITRAIRDFLIKTIIDHWVEWKSIPQRTCRISVKAAYHRSYDVPHRAPDLPYQTTSRIHQHHAASGKRTSQERHSRGHDSGVGHAHYRWCLGERRRRRIDRRYR